MKVEDADLFEKVEAQLKKLHEELAALSKKSPDNPINKFKLKLINEKLIEANRLLTGPHKPFAKFEIFEESDLPSTSDAVIVLSQYLSCLEGWRSANIHEDGIADWYWNVDDGTAIKTHGPSRFRREYASEDQDEQQEEQDEQEEQ
jgi:hypothetical protein